MIDWLSELFTIVHAWIFENGLQPLLYRFGGLGYAEQAFQGLEFALYGIIEIGIMLALIRPLEAWRPVEQWTDRRAVRVDVLYTFLHRLGIVPLGAFLLLRPLVETIDGSLRLGGYIPPSLEEAIPWLANHPLAAFLVYLLILDFAEYLRHRLQHRFNWWWALHALHHSQRQLSLWSDRRNHLLDDILSDFWIVLVALLIGVPPGHFLGLVVVTRLIESLSHANLRLDFGRIGRYFLVSPHYHRLHHGIGMGHEGNAHGCNFAPLFPLWDVLFGTARYLAETPATGIRDQLDGVDYGEGFLSQQWLGIKRLLSSLRGPL